MAAEANRGLQRVVWQRIQDSIITDCQKSEIWKVLILDHFTTKLLSSCCNMSDLMSEGITIVEDLYKSREPVPEMKAIYFISPNEKCIDVLIADFTPKPKYKSAYVYFTDYCPDPVFDKMKLHCAKFIRICKELNLSFLPQESQVFTCDNPGTFQHIYNPHSQDKVRTLEAVADQIVALCAALDEYPGIRYKKDLKVDNAKKLAELVDSRLTQHYERESENRQKKGKTPAQLLIVERGFDPVTPVLHELTYQAMAYDLIPIENDTYKFRNKDGSMKEAQLNESDDLWIRLRHLHIADVSAKYNTFRQIPKLLKEISANRKQTDEKMSISGLAQLMQRMPNHRKQLAQKATHLTLTEDCMNCFQKNVEKLCKVEQDLATGTDVDGQKIKDPMRTLLPVLLNPHSTQDKIRAVLLYVFSLNGTTEENLNKLLQHVNAEDAMEYILNWRELGVPIISSLSLFSTRKPSRRDRSNEEKYNLSRWTPVIKDVMEDVLENKLEAKEWPQQSETAAGWHSAAVVSARQKQKSSSQELLRARSRLIIFIIGGMSYSEMRCAYEVTQAFKSCEVIMGSSHIMTPTGLLDDIKALSQPPTEEMAVLEVAE